MNEDLIRNIIVLIFCVICFIVANIPGPHPTPIPPNPNPGPEPDPNPLPPVPDPTPPSPPDDPWIYVDPDPVIVPVTPTPVPPVPVPPLPPVPVPVPPVPIPPIPEVQPGDNVVWQNLNALRNESNGKWGDFLTDVRNHLAPSFGNQYYSDDRITHCHETTHGINSYIRNMSGNSGKGGFYVGYGKYCVIDSPRITLAQVASVVPANLRGSRYNLYLVQQRGDWNDFPLYIFDEWVAYNNGAKTGLEIVATQLGTTDNMIGPIEFAIYSLFMTDVIMKNDKTFLDNNTQYKEFLAFELKRALNIYKTGIDMPPYRWDKTLENELRRNAVCINVLQSLYGDKLTLDKLLS